MVKQLLSDPTVRSKTNLWSFLTGFVAIAVDEMIHQSQCSTSAPQDVLKRIHGENFKALEGKVAIITGASNGLGLENARCLMKYGCHVIWAVRSPDKAQSVLNQLEKQGKFSGKAIHGCGVCCVKATILKIELSDLTTVKPFVESFLKLNLPGAARHYLICNAGIMSPTEWLPSKQNFELQFATNNLSHFLLTELLMPKMQETLGTTGGPRGSVVRFRKPVVKGAATTMYCTVSPDVTPLDASAGARQHSKNGHFFYFNCGPQRPRNILGSREDLVEKCHQRQLELVKPYM
eukprot:Skav202863  [mRNA]  locus=scaffold3206:78382:87770:- [translate_table: standard]